MQRTAFTIAVLVVAFAVVSLCGMPCGNSKERRQAGTSAEINLKFSPDMAWENGIKFAMRWCDAEKKLVFESPRVTSALVWCGSGRAGFLVESPDGGLPLLHGKNEYNFDAGSVLESCTASDSGTQDGRVRYTLRWDEAKQAFVFPNLQYDSIKQMFNSQVYILWAAHNAEGWFCRK
jgi:hypothetical protein